MLKNSFTIGVIEAGCDEAGRGCLAGPVFAAAVILPAGFEHPRLNDSKQVKESDREMLRPIIEREAIAWAVCMSTPEEIDTLNILKASFKAMHAAIDKLATRPELLLIDGHIFPAYFGISHQCIVKGDSKFTSIAAASILAKTHRDEYMLRLHEEFPHYGWKNNKGYGTSEHLQGIDLHGITPHHRRSFAPCSSVN
ncbi:MAG: ribonuclease HII [Taibaiella sp.]|nr:ribonuclease HII [Taibaiella sp.]